MTKVDQFECLFLQLAFQPDGVGRLLVDAQHDFRSRYVGRQAV